MFRTRKANRKEPHDRRSKKDENRDVRNPTKREIRVIQDTGKESFVIWRPERDASEPRPSKPLLVVHKDIQ